MKQVLDLPFVVHENGETIERLIKRFKNRVHRAKIVAEVNKRKSFVKPSQLKRLKRRLSLKRRLKLEREHARYLEWRKRRRRRAN